MIVSLIVAASENNVIGNNNELIWNMPADMKYFMEKTRGHHVLMGRKNYDSIPDKYRPLPDRTNLVVSRKELNSNNETVYFTSIEDAVQFAESKGESELFIIGGGEIYKQTMDIADQIYLTRIHHEFEGDTYFPELKEEIWVEKNAEFRAADDKNLYDLTYYLYVKK